MKNLRSVAIAGVMALALPSLAMAQAPTTLTIPLASNNNSGVTGTAVITDIGGGKSKVVLTISGGKSATTGPAHIHSGKCPEVGAVVAPLTNLANGTSTTEVAVPISAMIGAAHAINLHETGVSGVAGYVACGNLVATPTAMPATGFGTRTIALGGAAGAAILGGLGAGISMIRRRVIASRG
ncbi:MAG: hypothetical protein EBQ56_03800 [Proteobacteria bacterium]|jgi:hypothetical protein|nr:hypothetical protein [Pseudomonadota bacterium]NCV22395.1 hypothetical protein [Chloroflexota bacterium]NBQ33450.1 hypothetical protein [Pseudomonadota bacterium]NBQ63187.1 hypothetical protein [Pseudomonadota bacterium]NBT05119.1 hypothetical protein [Pseudomonadota bacterium]